MGSTNYYAVLIALVVLALVRILSRKRKSKKTEDYTLLPSHSGITWFVGRRMSGHSGHSDHPDSAKFRESLGFIILGKADEQRYAVDPPLGWKHIRYGERGLHYYVTDENGEIQFWIFEKQEHHDFRTYIYVSEEMNEIVRKKQTETA